MQSEKRLHPLSIVFNILKQLGAVAIPIVLLIVGRGSDDDRYSAYALVFLVPYTLVAFGRYWSLRYRYEESELVIRRGILFRNQRHVPYARIQNIDAVQNLLHRLTGVVEVRLQTGGGSEPEATLSVLTVADLEEMRRRVFGARAVEPRETGEPAGEVPPTRVLLDLGPRELVIYGIVENKGMIVIGAAIGLFWEFANPRIFEQIIGEVSMRGYFRSIARSVFVEGGPSFRAVGVGLGLVLAFLIVSRIFSIGWSLVRLNGYRLSLTGDDLRAEYGLLTRVAATVPRRRIQTVTVRETLSHRVTSRAAVHVATAGGQASEAQKAGSQREWLAPIIRKNDVPGLLATLLPGVNLSDVTWQRVHPRAFRRNVVRRLIGAAVFEALCVAFFGWQALWLAPVLAVLCVVRARLYVSNLGWATTGDVVMFREGAFSRILTIAPLVRIQVVLQHESPFDRRHAMARVGVDTAGSGGGGGINVPYLARATADELYATLSAAASRTSFQW